MEMMMLQRATPCYGIHIENKSIRLEFNTHYSIKSDQSRFSECSAHPEKPMRFLHGRFGITSIQTAGSTKTKSHEEFKPEKYLGGGWWLGKMVTVSTTFSDGVILEPGVDFYRYFATTRGDAAIFGTNGQPLGNVAGSNMQVFSGYVRLTYQREFADGGVFRFFTEYLKAINMSMQDVQYGMITTGLSGGGNSGFDYKKWGIKFGVELYAKKFLSTRLVLGTSPGIKGRNSFATLISIGLPLAFGK